MVKSFKRIAVILTILLLSALLTTNGAFAGLAKITKIDVQEYEGKIQVNVFASGQIKYTVKDQELPVPAVVLEIYPAVFDSYYLVKNIPVGINTIKDVKVGQFSTNPNIVRVVVELDKPTIYETGISNDKKAVAIILEAPGVAGPKVFAKAQSRPKKVIKQPAPKLVTCNFKNADLVDVLKLFSDQTGENIITSGIQGNTSVTIKVKDVPLEEALNLLLKINDLDYRRMGNVIVVSTPEKLATQFPAPSPPEEEPPPIITQVINLEYADAEEVANVITASGNFPPGTITADKRIQSVIVKGTPSVIKDVRALIANLDVPGPPPPPSPPPPPPPVTQVFKVKYADAGEVATQMGGLVPPNSIIVDKRLNSLIVTGSEGTITTVKDFLASVDVPKPQIRLEVKVVEISDTVAKEFGINWPGSAISTFTENNPNGDIGFKTFTRSAISLQSTINWLLTNTKAKLLASPTITTMDRQEANIHLGDRIPLVYYDPRAGLYQATYIDVGVVVKVTPIISGDGFITTDIEPEVSSVTGYQQNFPTVATRKAKTSVRVKDGETIVIGGLIRDDERVSMSKIPILGDIPILGTLFRNKKTDFNSTEVIFLITPKTLNF